jgi:hypothetical protein
MDEKDRSVLQKHLLRFLVQDVCNAIDEEDVLKITGPNVWEHRGRQLTPGEVSVLRAEAQAFQAGKLWKVLRAELLYHAHERIVTKAQGESDLIAGKMLMYLTDVLETRLKSMAKV